MEKKDKSRLIIFLIGFAFIVFAIFRGYSLRPVYPVAESSPTQTITPPPYLGFNAITLFNADCFDWSYQILTNIDPIELVQVLGRNGNNTWFMVRWPKFTTACWVESSYLKPDNFSIADLPIVKASFPPPSTSTPTMTPMPLTTSSPIFTPTAAATATKGATFITPTKTSKPDESSNGSNNSVGQTQAAIAQTQTAQALTAQAAIAQTQTAQALTAQAAIAQTQTAQALTAQAAIAQTQTAQALTAQAAIAQTQTAQALTAQAAYWQTQTALACIISAPKLSGSRNGQNVRLSWSSVSGASSYEVFVSVNGGPESSLGKTNGTSANDSISNGSTNVYHVVAYSPCGNKYNTDSNTETIVR